MSLVLPDEARAAAALKVRAAHDVKLPRLQYWNYDPCELHTVLHPGCRKCGVEFRRHQRVTVTWTYLAQKSLVAHVMGLGKTISANGLMALMKERGELTGRAFVIMQAAALRQWQQEIHRMMPRMTVEIAAGTRSNRIERYCSNADIILIGYQMMLKDLEMIIRLEPSIVIVDDVDPARNETATNAALKRIARDCERVLIMNGTPLQNRLHELYRLIEILGGRQTFGSELAFTTRYVRKEPIQIWKDIKRGKKKVTVQKVTGYKNMNEFKEKLAPYVLRYTHRDLDGDDLPEVNPEDVWLDLYDRQRERYEELQEGVLRLQREEGETVKQATALAKFTYGAQICAGLQTLGDPDGPGQSSKLDWLLDKITGDLVGTKVVVFSQFKATIRTIHARLQAADRGDGVPGIGYATIWGDESNPSRRAAEQERFWTDPACRVIIGTAAMEKSLNLQISNILINVDTMLNPARMQQLVGRVRRLGSPHQTVWVYNLLTVDTQEERYLPILEAKQALSDFVWGETNELFAALSPFQLLQLIKP